METVVYTFCAYLPIHLLAYLPFLDLLRFGKGWMAATVAGNMAVHLLGVAWAMAAGRPELAICWGWPGRWPPGGRNWWRRWGWPWCPSPWRCIS